MLKKEMAGTLDEDTTVVTLQREIFKYSFCDTVFFLEQKSNRMFYGLEMVQCVIGCK